jgi:hypothetical protein
MPAGWDHFRRGEAADGAGAAPAGHLEVLAAAVNLDRSYSGPLITHGSGVAGSASSVVLIALLAGVTP